MKLDRNILPYNGKYWLIPVRKLDKNWEDDVCGAIDVIGNNGLIQTGDAVDDEFFVIKLRDKYAFTALKAYAERAEQDDPEWASEVRALAFKSLHHPNRHMPD